MTTTVSTHVLFPTLPSVVHVEGTKEEIIKQLVYPAMGVEFNILAKDPNRPGGKYFRTSIWVGPDNCRRAYVMDEHIVEVSDEPYVYPPERNNDELLTVEL